MAGQSLEGKVILVTGAGRGIGREIALLAAREGGAARFNVRSNCISPFAWSRLIGTIPTETPEEKARVERIKTMGAEKIAPLAVFLASDLARDVTGQIFGIRRNEVFLFSQPRAIRSVHRSEGWTPQTMAEHMLPALKTSFYPLERSGDVFTWDPI